MNDGNTDRDDAAKTEKMRRVKGWTAGVSEVGSLENGARMWDEGEDTRRRARYG